MKWKKHPRYRDYLISDTGLVKRIKSKIILKPWKVSHGYERVEVYKNGKYRSEYVHRLVAETFLPRHPLRNEVNHRDGNKANNNLDNLEWCTRQENMAHGVGGKSTKKVRISANGKVYPSMAEAARDLGITTDTIMYILAGTVSSDMEVVRI